MLVTSLFHGCLDLAGKGRRPAQQPRHRGSIRQLLGTRTNSKLCHVGEVG